MELPKIRDWSCPTCKQKINIATKISKSDVMPGWGKEVDRLNCNNISCHQGRDILDSIFEAMNQLPCNGIQGILCGAAQEIQALRDMSNDFRAALIKTGCSDILCAENKRNCSQCPCSSINKQGRIDDGEALAQEEA